jgi:anti-sigma regulatory factor (Ser/Thr protein kinase)
MIIKHAINIQDDKFLNGLQAVLALIDQINKSKDALDIIDFEGTSFVTPLFILPLMVFIKGCKKQIQFTNVNTYLNTVCFGDGLRPDDMRNSKFIAVLECYSRKTYIPIISFPAQNNTDDEKNAILTAVENIIVSQLGLGTNITAGLKYMIEESVDNITEHSDSDRGYIFAQAYPTKKYLDICIADNGITLLGSYKKLPDNGIESDIEAIQAANRGISTKNLPYTGNRGYGIMTSKNMLIKGLSGHYVMISGKALHIKNQEIDKYIVLPRNIKWHGTIVALRLPYINRDFQYINYVE